MNAANFVTFARIALIPLFVFFMYASGSGERMDTASWLALATYMTASLSDYVDGYLARRFNTITKLGQFLDPLADKVLVGAALVTLIAFRGFPAWAAVVIAVREIAIVSLRSAAMSRGNSMPASRHAKHKTTIQLLMVLVWLFPRTGLNVLVQDLLVYAAVLVTVLSGLRYAVLSKQLLTRRPIAERSNAAGARGQDGDES
ncbi:MAG: CDP-diacylglycerol--glycerol-3-phosphate 3-phosphatidyltransferase [Actinomycetota bacterium]|nr:CDP-diacylglycerol--glycerol-3-phosphate 3-phosphatidyltransferase [Actinomycetota bacterium]